MTDELSVRDAAQMTGYSRQTIYNLVKDGKIQARKQGWEIWISKRSLLAYCASRKRGVVVKE